MGRKLHWSNLVVTSRPGRRALGGPGVQPAPAPGSGSRVGAHTVEDSDGSCARAGRPDPGDPGTILLRCVRPCLRAGAGTWLA